MTNNADEARRREEWTNDEFERVIDIGGNVMSKLQHPDLIEVDDVIRGIDGGYAVVTKVLTNGVNAKGIGILPGSMFFPFDSFTFIGKNWSPR